MLWVRMHVWYSKISQKMMIMNSNNFIRMDYIVELIFGWLILFRVLYSDICASDFLIVLIIIFNVES